MGWLHDILHNDYIIWCAMAVIIFLATQVLKLPIKLCTKHIKNERTRKIVNATILLIPFALGVLLEFLYSTYYLHTVFTVITGLGYGTTGITLYSTIERFFKVKTNNPYNSKEGKAVTDFIENITADGKTDSTDKSAVQEFLEQINKQ